MITVIADQCEFGLTTVGPNGHGLAQKPTRFMTNSACIAQNLDRRCRNTRTHSQSKHEHIPPMNGRAKAAQKYPNVLRKAICKGLVKQMQVDRQGQFMFAALERSDNSSAAHRACMSMLQEVQLAEETCDPELLGTYDDVSGAPLGPDQVCRARMEEVEFIRNMGLYTKVLIDECWRNTGKGPISTKWIDINKGDGRAPKYRPRDDAANGMVCSQRHRPLR